MGCGSACRQSPSSLVSPLPRLAGVTAHPALFQGVSRGKQRTPHICDCIRGKKKDVSLAKSFIRKKIIIQKSVVNGKYLVRSLCNFPPFLSMQLIELFANCHIYNLNCWLVYMSRVTLAKVYLLGGYSLGCRCQFGISGQITGVASFSGKPLFP